MQLHTTTRTSRLSAVHIAVASLLSLSRTAHAQMDLAPERVAQIVSALPSTLRADATILSYDAQGNPTIQRQGGNIVFCVSGSPAQAFSSRCYADALRPQRDFEAKLRAGGNAENDVQAAVKAAMASGQLPRPLAGTTRYVQTGTSETDIRTYWVILLPGATTASTGLPAGDDQAAPHLVEPGTAGAYLIVPQSSLP